MAHLIEVLKVHTNKIKGEQLLFEGVSLLRYFTGINKFNYLAMSL
jgi:hypothetical protein